MRADAFRCAWSSLERSLVALLLFSKRGGPRAKNRLVAKSSALSQATACGAGIRQTQDSFGWRPVVTLRRNTPSLLFLRKLRILEVLGCDRTDDHPTDGVVVVDCKVAETDVVFRRWASVTSRKPSSANISNALLIRTSRRSAPRRTSPSPAIPNRSSSASDRGVFQAWRNTH